MDFTKLINNMTLPEKLAQMSQLHGDYYISDDKRKADGTFLWF